MKKLLQTGLARIFAGSKKIKRVSILKKECNIEVLARQINAACKLRFKKDVCHYEPKLHVIVVDDDADSVFSFCKGFSFFTGVEKTTVNALI